MMIMSFTVLYPKTSTPPLALTTASVLLRDKVKLVVKPDDKATLITLIERKSLEGEAAILRYICLSSNSLLPPESSPLDYARVEEFVTLALRFSNNGITAEDVLSRLNSYLTLRTYIYGYDASFADLVLWSALKKIDLTPQKKQYPHVCRWSTSLDQHTVFAAINTTVSEEKKEAPKKV
jgi:hypothetical protein